ncbi:MAG TPA: CBS domain-containing protein [Candidatus Bathyarchaeia archaeon]|nr:CBS domain-containing protein [Candidatus Bathyarchaeia archaeon]
MSLEAQDIMVDKVITARKDASLDQAVQLMNEHEIGCLVIVENDKPIGIITERDLLKRCLARSKELRGLKVSDVMSQPLVVVSPKTEIEEAAKVMCEKKIKKLPIVEEGRLRGLITLTDILRIQPQLIRMYKIFSSDLAPRRMKKVFDYYLLLRTKDVVHLEDLQFLKEDKLETK